jgi:cell division protein FtsL
MNKTLSIMLIIWCLTLSVCIIWTNSIQGDINKNLKKATEHLSEASKLHSQAISLLAKRR